jgi:hypothetical protein
VFIIVLVGIINNSWPWVLRLNFIICSLHKIKLVFSLWKLDESNWIILWHEKTNGIIDMEPSLSVWIWHYSQHQIYYPFRAYAQTTIQAQLVGRWSCWTSASWQTTEQIADSRKRMQLEFSHKLFTNHEMKLHILQKKKMMMCVAQVSFNQIDTKYSTHDLWSLFRQKVYQSTKRGYSWSISL